MADAAFYRNPIARDGDFADPFVLRHDGRYYLYCTNPDLRCWSSEDLLTWQAEGPTIDEDEFPGLVPFAPEVIYRDGSFYLYTSPSGHGHFVLRADRPTGPFRAVTGNVGHAIDGHVFLNDDGRSYFYWAGDEGIWGCEMPTPTSFGEPHFTGIHMNGWTEGPLIIKRDGRYHMTLTGNHYLSAGYRIDAAVSDHPLTGFRGDPLNPVLVATTGPLVGLGHSSTVVGPDLVTQYLVYHNLNPDHSRDLDVDRQVWNGESLQVLGPSRYAPAPGLPDQVWRAGASPSPFDGSRDDERGAVVPSGSRALWRTGDVGPSWTLELCVTVTGPQPRYGIRSVDGAVVVLLDAESGEIAASGGIATSSALLDRDHRHDVLHTLGIESDAGRLRVRLDGRLMLTLEDVLSSGELEIVTLRGDVLISSAALTRATAASADRGAIIPVPGRFWATLSGSSCRRVEPSGLGFSLEAVEIDAGSEASFDLVVDEAGSYVIGLVGKFSEGVVLSVRVDGVSQELTAGPATRAVAAALDLPGGVCRLEVGATTGSAVLTLVEVQPASDGSIQTVAAADGHRKILMGYPQHPDFSLELLLNAPDDNLADVLFRASDLADGGEGDDPVLGSNFFRGYSLHVGPDTVTIARHSYDETVLATTSFRREASPSRVALRVRGGRFEVEIDSVPVLSAEDALPYLFGGVGLRSRGGRVEASDIRILGDG